MWISPAFAFARWVFLADENFALSVSKVAITAISLDYKTVVVDSPKNPDCFAVYNVH